MLDYNFCILNKSKADILLSKRFSFGINYEPLFCHRSSFYYKYNPYNLENEYDKFDYIENVKIDAMILKITFYALKRKFLFDNFIAQLGLSPNAFYLGFGSSIIDVNLEYDELKLNFDFNVLLGNNLSVPHVLEDVNMVLHINLINNIKIMYRKFSIYLIYKKTIKFVRIIPNISKELEILSHCLGIGAEVPMLNVINICKYALSIFQT